MATAPPPSASRYYVASAVAAKSATQAARAARPRGARAVWNTVSLYQVAQAQVAEQAIDLMLAQQEIDVQADALLNSAGFATAVDSFQQMLDQVSTDWQFDQLVASLTQDAGRAAQSVAIAARARIGHVRMLNPPSCGRCSVLAGRVYRYSEGFLRHPGCDCTMIPTTLANTAYVQDPADLMSRGLVTGLSEADQRAIRDGADFAQVVNVRLRKAGLTESGTVLTRRGRPSPAGIYRSAGNDRELALTLLQQHGYLR